jgi:hypothetical protein
MSPQAPAYVIASIESDYFSLIFTKNIIIRYLKVTQYITYLIIKNLKEYRAVYLILYTEPQPFSRTKDVTI